MAREEMGEERRNDPEKRRTTLGRKKPSVVHPNDAAIMTVDPVTIDADDSIAHAIEKMLKANFHHLPAVKGGAVIGTIDNDDIPEEYRLLLEHYKELRS